jgi:hypothetical protein
MRKLVPLLAGLAAVVILGLPGSLARAKTYKSYISATGTANVNCTLATPLCLSEIKLAHTDDEVRQEMA